MDVCSISMDDDKGYVNFLMIRNGAVVDTRTVEVEKKLEETPEEMLAFSLAHFRDTFKSEASEVIAPFPLDFPADTVTITVPRAGDKKKLLELSEKNVNHFIEDRKRKKSLLLSDEDRDLSDVLLQLQSDLSLQDLPVHIECFDNSNFQGSYPVSAMVCFRDGRPSKKDYRHFNVKTVTGINDFATMKEVVSRRYKRLLAEQVSLPQLVIIDGGKGQLSAAMEAIESLGLVGRMTVVGLAKNEEEIFYTGDSESLKLPFQGTSLRLMRQIRDEVHRFGISFHRKKRAQGTFKNELENIHGIGDSTADTLLKTFRSVNNIATATEDELEKQIGKAKAKLVWNHFHNNTSSN